TSTEASCRVRIEGRLRMILCHIEDVASESLAKPTILLDPELRGRLEFHRQNEPSDAGDSVSPAESSYQFYQPVAINDHIIICKRQNLAPGCHQSTIACPRRTCALFTDIAHLGHLAISLPDHLRCSTAAGSVINNDDLIARVVQGQQRLHT